MHAFVDAGSILFAPVAGKGSQGSRGEPVPECGNDFGSHCADNDRVLNANAPRPRVEATVADCDSRVGSEWRRGCLAVEEGI
jgi:hypothetical protein